MSVFNSISVSVLIVLLVTGLMSGLFAAGTDLLNPYTSQAEAERISVDTQHQATMNGLAEQREQAKTQAEIASILRQQDAEQKRYEAELRYLEQLYAKKLDAYDRWIKVRDALLLVFGSATSLAFLILISTKAALMLRTARPAHQGTVGDEATRQYWHKRREIARAYERQLRSAALMEARMKAVRDPASITQKPRDDLPLAV